jgi:hypothetical protein
MIIDVRYCGYSGGRYWAQYAVDGWEGPIKGAIGQALRLVESAIQQLAWEGTDPSVYTLPLATLATHVLPDAAPYRDWSRQVLDRLQATYPRDPDDELGDVVPRQAVDPTVPFTVEQAEAMINEFLAGLDHRSNIFLTSPEGMEAPDDEGRRFQGTPYVFDMEADRLARQENASSQEVDEIDGESADGYDDEETEDET